MGDSVWASSLVPLAIGLAFDLFRRFFPARPAADSEAPLTDEERRVYRRWEGGSLLLFFIIAPVLIYAWYFDLKEAADLVRHASPGTRYLVRPSPIYWDLPAIFLGMFSSALPLECIHRCLLRDRFHRYKRFSNERLGFDGRRVVLWISALITGGSVVWFYAGVMNFARFSDAGVEIGRPLAFRSTFYKYTRVKAIEHRATFRAPNGNIIPRPHYVLRFDDEVSWSTRRAFHDPGPDLGGQIARLVAQRSGRLIEEHP